MTHTPYYTVFWAITYTGKATEKKRKVFEAPIDRIREARKQAFTYADSLKDVIEQEQGDVKSWSILIVFRGMAEGEMYVACEGSLHDRSAFEVLNTDFDLAPHDILIGLHLEYEHYDFWKLLSGEPGLMTDEHDRQIEVLPEVIERLSKGIQPS